MKTLPELFQSAIDVAKLRNWDKISIAVDLHNTVLKPTHNKLLATEFYPYAKECLSILSENKFNGVECLLFPYSCTPSNLLDVYLSNILEPNGIKMYHDSKFVADRMCVDTTSFQSFAKKPYFNILLDDKAGFDPNNDWEELYNYLIREYEDIT